MILRLELWAAAEMAQIVFHNEKSGCSDRRCELESSRHGIFMLSNLVFFIWQSLPPL